MVELSTNKMPRILTEWDLFREGGGGGGAADVIEGFQGLVQVRQVQKWQLAQKEKSADFKSPNLCSSAYTPINYNHRL